MTLDTADTIVAVATARGPSARGAVRVSGPLALQLVTTICFPTVRSERPQRIANQTIRCQLDGAVRSLAADLFVWPDQRSYTGQPTVEIHTVGSPVVLDAIVRSCISAGARLAEPGEFTLRAMLAGRMDLTQAEAVLGVIDATTPAALDAALTQLAGNLSKPLHDLRSELLGLLADLEAGLDFVEEEDIRFVEQTELVERLAAAALHIEQASQQMQARGSGDRLPRVLIVGPPNVGKSSLFNALTQRFGIAEQTPAALVADEAGVTRDALEASIEYAGVQLQLVDTAGADQRAAIDPIDAAARERLADLRDDADLLVVCQTPGTPALELDGPTLVVTTMSDRSTSASQDALATSSVTGEGIAELTRQITERVAASAETTGVVTQTAERSRAGLEAAGAALRRAQEAATAGWGEELVSLELRDALDALGRVVGEVVTEEVLGEVFGKFCIGK